MTKRRSLFFTSAPSLKVTAPKYPLTRARSSTISTASSRPGYSSHSITSRVAGWLAVTAAGGGGGGGWGRRQPVGRLSTVTSAPRGRVRKRKYMHENTIGERLL